MKLAQAMLDNSLEELSFDDVASSNKVRATAWEGNAASRKSEMEQLIEQGLFKFCGTNHRKRNLYMPVISTSTSLSALAPNAGPDEGLSRDNPGSKFRAVCSKCSEKCKCKRIC